LGANKKTFLIIAEMGCPALGVSVALPGEAPQTKKHSKVKHPPKKFFKKNSKK
jgi:hypothetical protein